MTETTDDQFFQTFEFKGVEIPPLSYARRSLILGMVNPANLSFMDAPTFLYGAICPQKDLIRARRNPEKFDEAVAAWIDKVEFSEHDADEASRVISALLANSDANRAEPTNDASLSPDPLGN